MGRKIFGLLNVMAMVFWVSAPGGYVSGTETTPKMPKVEFIGIIEVPKITPEFDSEEEVETFKPQPIRIYDSPSLHSTSFSLTDREKIYFKGLGGGWAGPAVFEEKNGFFKILVENKFMWMNKEDGARYLSFEWILKDRGGGIMYSSRWDRKVFDAPNGSFKVLPPLRHIADRGSDRKVEFVEAKMVSNHLWFKLKFKGRPCSEGMEDKEVHAIGWVRAFAEGTGQENVWVRYGC